MKGSFFGEYRTVCRKKIENLKQNIYTKKRSRPIYKDDFKATQTIQYSRKNTTKNKFTGPYIRMKKQKENTGCETSSIYYCY